MDEKQPKKRGILFVLFFTMLKIGLFTFGGGYAMLALLCDELVEKKKWIDKDDFSDMVAIAESTPGPVAVNASTYVGYRVAKIWGAIVATIGVCLPSFVIIFLVSMFFDAFMTYRLVQYAFNGIRVCVTFLILSAGVKLFKNMEKTAYNYAVLIITILACVAISLFSLGFSTVWIILIAGVAGVCAYLIKLATDKKKKSVAPSDQSEAKK